MEYMSDIGRSANAYRPSLFEVVAEEKMKAMLRPALKYVLTVRPFWATRPSPHSPLLATPDSRVAYNAESAAFSSQVYAQHYPRYLLRAVNWFDELYSLAMCAVEHHYLRQTGGSFAENFYSLKRAKTGRPLRREGFPADLSKNSKNAGLSPAEVRLSLLLLVWGRSRAWKQRASPHGQTYRAPKLDDFYETVSGRTRTLLLGDEFEDADDEPNAPGFASRPLVRNYQKKSLNSSICPMPTL
ncbi:MAG: hypothetical protein BJ554DRAFT_6227 [Olpidium bornovanus]|uniref:Peroxisome assembly protein 12 n=1 Tax=Olpidium bornovanus TaxID=278681 RepID=A0A8H8DKU9_9FUNG|nr:MAG: hypothetical protein BJ554DRAFT_6227 [Olpidium bornovanus]